MNNNVNMAGIKKILIKVIFCVSFLLCVPSYVMAADSTKDTVEIETVFSDVDNAAAALRDNMEKRITRTALYYQVEKNEMTNTEIKEYGEELHQKIYLEAMKHTGDPEGGDYIYWSLYFISKNPGSTTYQLDGDMVVYRLYYYSSYRTTTEQEAEAQIERKPPENNVLIGFMQYGPGLLAAACYGNGEVYLEAQNGELFRPEDYDNYQIVSKSGTRFTVENDGSSYASVPVIGQNVTYADNPIQPKKKFRDLVRDLHLVGHSVEEIALELNSSTTEVQMVLDMI